jgi:hypothetical protein
MEKLYNRLGLGFNIQKMDYGHCDSLKWTLLERNWMYKYGFKKIITKILQIGYLEMVIL